MHVIDKKFGKQEELDATGYGQTTEEMRETYRDRQRERERERKRARERERERESGESCGTEVFKRE